MLKAEQWKSPDIAQPNSITQAGYEKITWILPVTSIWGLFLLRFFLKEMDSSICSITFGVVGISKCHYSLFGLCAVVLSVSVDKEELVAFCIPKWYRRLFFSFRRRSWSCRSALAFLMIVELCPGPSIAFPPGNLNGANSPENTSSLEFPVKMLLLQFSFFYIS